MIIRVKGHKIEIPFKTKFVVVVNDLVVICIQILNEERKLEWFGEAKEISEWLTSMKKTP